MTPHTDAPEGPSLRRLADAAEDRLGEHGLALRDRGVLGPEDPAASPFAAASRLETASPPTSGKQ